MRAHSLTRELSTFQPSRVIYPSTGSVLAGTVGMAPPTSTCSGTRFTCETCIDKGKEIKKVRSKRSSRRQHESIAARAAAEANCIAAAVASRDAGSARPIAARCSPHGRLCAGVHPRGGATTLSSPCRAELRREGWGDTWILLNVMAWRTAQGSALLYY